MNALLKFRNARKRDWWVWQTSHVILVTVSFPFTICVSYLSHFLFGSSSLVHDFTVTCKADSCHKLWKHGKVDFLTILTNWNHGRHPRTQSQNQSQSHCDTEPMFTNDWFLSAWWLVWAREFSWWPVSLLSIWGQLLPILADRLTINLSTGLSSASDF